MDFIKKALAKKKIKEIEVMTRQKELCEIITSSKNEFVALAALDRLGELTEIDQKTYIGFARNAKNSFIRSMAISLLDESSNQEVLEDIARNDKDFTVRVSASISITDQTVLADIARSSNDSSFRFLIVGDITDRAILTDFAENDKDESVREAAQEQLEELQEETQ
jgi:HEAT repeat protein